MFRHPIIVYVTVLAFLLSACGVDYKLRMAPMSQDDALKTLMDVPSSAGRSIRGNTSNLSSKELQTILEDLVRSGKIQVKTKGRNAISGAVDLSMLNNFFTLLQSGKANSIFSLAKGLISMNSGNSTGTGNTLDMILQILNAALPIISSIAPQYAPIVQALTVIVPLVISVISLFAKPKVKTA